jgi:hypothetical protein
MGAAVENPGGLRKSVEVTRVIHFGLDDCYRVPVLLSAGFEVKEATSLGELRADLDGREQPDAVLVSEDPGNLAEQAAEMARRVMPGPVILFRRSQRCIDEKKFDRVYTCTTPPAVWLSETAALIAKSYRLQAKAARLLTETAAVQAETRRQLMRARQLRDPLSDRE